MSQSLRVLILEDNPADVALCVRPMKKGGYDIEAVHVDHQDAFAERLGNSYDVILADDTLPQFNARQALQMVRERGLDVPFLVVSGTIGEDAAVEMMKQGADDYLLKDRLAQLGTAVGNALEQRRLRKEHADIEERKRAEQVLGESEGNYRQLFDGRTRSRCGSATGRRWRSGRSTRSPCRPMATRPMSSYRCRSWISALRRAVRRWKRSEVWAGNIRRAEDLDALAPRRIGAADRHRRPRPSLRRPPGAVGHGHRSHRAGTPRRELEASERRSRELTEGAPIGIYRTAPDGRILFVNPALARMFGYDDPRELLRAQPGGRRLRGLLRPGGFQAPAGSRGRNPRPGGHLTRKDGSRLFVRENARLVRSQDGGDVYYEGTVEDITERRQVEEALRKSEAMLKESQRVAAVGHYDFERRDRSLDKFGDDG